MCRDMNFPQGAIEFINPFATELTNNKKDFLKKQNNKNLIKNNNKNKKYI